METKINDLLNYYEPEKEVWFSKADRYFPATQNVVLTVDCKQQISLGSITQAFGVQSLRKSRLSVATIRFSCGRVGSKVPTIQLFERGQAVIVGATSEEVSILYCHMLRFFLLNIGIPVKCDKMVVWNRVCSGNYPYGIDTINFGRENIVTLVKDKGGFPGVMYTTEEFKITFFPTGKFIVMGMGEKEDRTKFLRVMPIFEKYRLSKTPIVLKAQTGMGVVCDLVQKRGITDISHTDKATLLKVAKDAIDLVDFGEIEEEEEDVE